MTTERGIRRGVLLALPLAVLGWIAVTASVALFTDAAPGAVAFFPSEGFVTRLPDGAALVDARPLAVTVASDAPDLARGLYAAGALLVLPAGLPGCLPLTLPRTPPASI